MTRRKHEIFIFIVDDDDRPTRRRGDLAAFDVDVIDCDCDRDVDGVFRNGIFEDSSVSCSLWFLIWN
jgi:hypothetical protein